MWSLTATGRAWCRRSWTYLRRQGIHSIGRYGSWNYSSMADDIQMAQATAARINRA